MSGLRLGLLLEDILQDDPWWDAEPEIDEDEDVVRLALDEDGAPLDRAKSDRQHLNW